MNIALQIILCFVCSYTAWWLIVLAVAKGIEIAFRRMAKIIVEEIKNND